MAQCSITLHMRVSWWVRPYIHAVTLFAILTGMTPDFDKVARTCMRGIKVSV